MPRFIKDRSKAKGEAPGSLIFIGNQKLDTPLIHLIQYNTEGLNEYDFDTIEEAFQAIRPGMVNWINVDGIHDSELLQKIGQLFSLPQLLLEDFINTDQYPRYEPGENYDALILKMIQQTDNSLLINAEQLSMVLGEHFILTLQEQPGDVFTPIRHRIRKQKGRLRSKNADYLAYALLDAVVENYNNLIENFGRRVEDIDDIIFQNNGNNLVSTIYKLKTELNFLRKSIRPFRDVAAQLLKSEETFFEPDNKQYLADLHGEVHQAIENIEFYMSLLSDQLNTHHTNIQNRQNEVMKVLTVFASIFIPLTFLAGIYGMNFKYFPELNYQFSYPAFWLASLSIVTVLLLYFKRKKWL